MEPSIELGTSRCLGRFGRLPSDVRRRIYTLLGLPKQGLPKHALFSLDARSLGLAVRLPVHVRKYFATNLDEPVDGINESFQPLVHLMLTCREMYNEISAMLYAENKFIVQDHRALRKLRPSTLGHLTQLCVLLHSTKMLSRDLSRTCHYPQHELPLDPSSTEGQALLAEWKETVRFLAAHVLPGRLDLELVCEIANHQYKAIPGHADLVAHALRDLPPLAAFHLRLGGWCNDKLSSEARLLATKHLAVKPDPTPFRFMDLPQELRLHILRYTDLVTPRKSVTWDLAHGYRLSIDMFSHFAQPPNIPCLVESGNGCFCRRVHAVWSPRCGCWENPASLFLVSRQMTEDARVVFYGENVIDLAANNAEERSGEYTATTFFGRVLCPETVRHLRDLKIASFNCNDEKGGETASVEGWRRVRDELVRSGELRLRRLTIQSHREDLPGYNTLIEPETSARGFAAARQLIHRYIWPLSRDGVRPFGTRYLGVEMRRGSFELEYMAEEVDGAGSSDGPSLVREKWTGPIADYCCGYGA
ncbi:hypothetical protein B0T11DRAFT_276557 [Plectosphaerella cucumerina]|uniref:DUF7730 domain-containing protein n=1 Tax=Plectosphaerella cucumerina TaxID=40658 RepID=A0A8K0TJ84_9PEZI|nr:hypothetical protein B0T11DRAFT_276557 [Plectosphaerella cucumerina]